MALDTPKRLLIACDGLGRGVAIPPAVASMARLFDAEAILVNVAPHVPGSWWLSTALHEELQASLIKARQDHLEELGRSLRGVPTQTVVRQGEPHIEIVRAALQHHCDVVVVVDDPELHSRGRSFGTTTMKLMRKCPLPVWAVREGSERPKRVMAAIDGEPDKPEGQHLNRQVLELALAFTPPRAAPLTILHAWSLWGEEMLGTQGLMSPEELTEEVAKTEREHRRWLQSVVDEGPFDEGDVQVELVKGDPTRVVPEVVDRDKVDLLVMGTVARTGLPGLFMGNTAEHILNSVGCSVIAVKPADFVSPIADLITP
jgi:nucleotide-binding universal stress UspA family protein